MDKLFCDYQIILNKYTNESTRKIIINILKWYQKVLDVDTPLTYQNFDDNTSLIIDKLKTIAISSQQTSLAYLECIYKLKSLKFPEPYEAHLKDIRIQLDEKHKIDNNKDISDETKLDINDVQIWLKQKLNKINLTNWMNYVIIAILNEIPLRSNPLSNIEWIDTQTNNYIDLINHTIILRKHKTIGIKTFYFSDSLKQILDDYKQYQATLLITSYVFIQKNKILVSQPQTEMGINKMLNYINRCYCDAHDYPISDHRLSIHFIRHQYASREIKRCNISQEQIRALLNMSEHLGHGSLNTTLNHYYRQA